MPEASLGWGVPDWLTVVGFPAVLLALYLGWHQLKKTKTAAESASAAIGRTEARLADNHLLMLVPDVGRLGVALDLAARQGGADAAVELLSQWLRVSNELSGILERSKDVDTELLRALDRATFLTGTAKNEIIEGGQDVELATRELRRLVTEIHARSSKMVGRMRAYTGAENE